jgi:hypothetical protein
VRRFSKSAHGALFGFLQKRTACAFAITYLPVAALASETQPSDVRRISLDIAATGALATLCSAATAWFLASRRKAKDDRQPPLGEDVARTYASKSDLATLDAKVAKDIESLRESIAENDRRAEDRSRGTHARIDAVYKEQQKVNRSLGMLTGVLIGGKCQPGFAQNLAEINEE